MATYNLTTNTSTTAERGADYPHRGNTIDVYFIARGTWGGGTLTVQYSIDGTNFVSDTSLAFTEDAVAVIAIKPAIYYRATLAGATSPDLSVTFT